MKKTIFAVLKTLVAAYLVTGMLLLIFALIMQKFGLNSTQVRLFVIMIYGISTIVGGLIFSKIKKKKRFLCGLIFGVVYFMVLICISAIVNHGFEHSLSENIISFAVCAIGGIIGGIMG